MEHFITEVQINEVRHLENITIKLNSEKRQHLILTGKNGSGKTSVLRAMKSYLQAINDGKLNDLTGQYQEWYEADILKVKNASTENEKYKLTRQPQRDTILEPHWQGNEADKFPPQERVSIREDENK